MSVANAPILQDTSVVDIACAGLNGMKMGDKTLTVRRATARSALSLPPFAKRAFANRSLLH